MSIDFMDLEREFLSKLKNKRLLIDYIWQTKPDEHTDFSVRDIIANELFSPYSIEIKEIYNPLWDKSDNEEDFYRKLKKKIYDDLDFKKKYSEIESSCIRNYKTFWDDYSGLNSLVAFIILNREYPDEFLDIKKKLGKWYKQDRIMAYKGLNRFYYNNPFLEAIPAISAFLSDFSAEIFTAVFASGIYNEITHGKTVRVMINEFVSHNKVKKMVNSKMPRNLLFEELFLLDTNIEQIERFKEYTVNLMFDFMALTFNDKHLTVLEKIENGFTIDDIENMPDFFVKVEFKNGLTKHIFDPFFKAII